MAKTKILISVCAVLLLIVGGYLMFFSMQNAIKLTDSVVLDAVAKAEDLSAGYFYDEALLVLNETGKADDKRIVSLKEDIETKKANLKEYDGTIYHVFFHSLIVYPELAFDGDYMHEGYDMWMTTVSG